MIKKDPLFASLKEIVGRKRLLTRDRDTEPYRRGYREGYGPALAVVLPSTLLEQFKVLQVCVAANVNIIMQAANTGLTGGSTPTEGIDRHTVIINISAIDTIHYLDQYDQIVALSGATLFTLENQLKTRNRTPHSVIGSSCIGASIVGGVCNNSGGALVERGSAYTEMSLYAEVNEDGDLRLVNELDIDLGTDAEEILRNLEMGNFTPEQVYQSEKKASDDQYKHHVREINSNTPARYNANPRNLYKASGCAGKLAVFAVRLNSFLAPQRKQSFFLSTHSTATLGELRRMILQQGTELPISAEYIHRDVLTLADQYAKDTVFMIKHFGTNYLPQFFRLKQYINGIIRRTKFLGNHLFDQFLYFLFKILGSKMPKVFFRLNQKYPHHLLIAAKNHGIEELQELVNQINEGKSTEEQLHLMSLSEKQATEATLLRYACASAAIQYEAVNHKTVAGLIALDIALPRNSENWFEELPQSINEKLISKLYYGHLLCHVFHQDYLVKKGEDIEQVKALLLAHCEARGAKYPAEHNVGHHYQAEPVLAQHYQTLDPTNTFNAGIGGLSKQKHYGTLKQNSPE